MKKFMLLIVVIIFAVNISYSQSFRILHHFDSTVTCGYQPHAGSITISNDTIYGVATKMDTLKKILNEVIYKMHIDGSGFEIVHEFFEKEFNDKYAKFYQNYRMGSLIIVNNVIYGTINTGGSGFGGFIFSINTDGSDYKLLHNFIWDDTDGFQPVGKLVYSDSVLYGVTYGWVNHSSENDELKNPGIVYRIYSNGKYFMILHEFIHTDTDARESTFSLILKDSFLYGITWCDGTPNSSNADQGIEFKINTDGKDFKYLRSKFKDKFFTSTSSAIFKSDSTFYCTTAGFSNYGTLYRLNPDGTGYNELHKFKSDIKDGFGPIGELAGTNDFIYGTTELGGTDSGTVYRIKKDGSNYEILHNFISNNQEDGSKPYSGLVLYKGALYGTTYLGGKNNFGTLYVYRDVVIQDSCGNNYFNFPDFSNSLDIILNEKAKVKNSVIKLSESKPFERSSVYYKNPMIISSGFRTEFSFRFYNGFNSDNDGSPAGADGITFIIQANTPNETGNGGGGLGYEGIANSLVIEYDAFKNNIFNDPDGSHIGVFTNGKGINSSIHQSKTDIGTTSNIPQLKADSTIYNSRIEYNYESKKLKIWLDTTTNFKNPAIEIKSVDISKILDLIDGKKAYVGFTSATGDSYQSTELLSWSFCPSYDNSIASSVEEAVISERKDEIISPNPATDYIEINTSEVLKTSEVNDIQIFDMLGVIVLKVEQASPSVQKINISNLSPGIYFIKIGNRVEKFVKM
jgi:hypothetical protein